MSMHYANPLRAGDEHALPNLETFYRAAAAIRADDWRDEDGELMGEGWYVWSCFPGCLPDGEPMGPFGTEAEALELMLDD